MTVLRKDTVADLGRTIAELQRQLDERSAELNEALEQQSATAEVLQVINSSPGDLTSVFEAMLDKAVVLCGAAFGVLWTYEGERVHAAAHRGLPPALVEFLTRVSHPIGSNNAHSRLHEGEPMVHVADAAEDKAYRSGDPVRRALVDLGGGRSLLAAPLRKDDALLGAFVIYRRDVRPFSDKQIALLQNFAAQAVIAMENARLLGQLRTRTGDLEESLKYQIATSDVLKVISRSTFDLQPVLETVCRTAQQLCGAGLAGIAVRSGDVYRYVATSSVNPEWVAKLREIEFTPGRDSVAGRVALERRVVHVDDLAADPEYGHPGFVAIGGARTALGVPLLREGEPIGVIFLGHDRVRPFTAQQIELVRTFADQAVIAMENARLLGELRARTGDLEESLQYQTATSDVLKVISRSTFDLQPILDTLVETAARLCQADMGLIASRDGDVYRGVASFAYSPEYAAFWRSLRLKPSRQTITGRAALDRQVVHIADTTADPEYLFPEAITIGKNRTLLGVPLLREGEPIGVISFGRQRVEPFTERQIELVRTFADQAVIAIENTRLINETREALEQQTATAEVLRIISSAPGELAPVFDAVLEKAMRLCEAAFGGLWTFDGDRYVAQALRGVPAAYAEFLTETTLIPGPGTAPHRYLRGERSVIQSVDLADEEPYRSGQPQRRALVELGGARTALHVPLCKDDTVLGVITIYRQEVRPFSDKQIEVLQNFAAQAVIALENTRLITETREALEQQTATAEVLRIINKSPGSLAPVFDAMLDKALALCEAAFGLLWTYDGERLHAAAMRGVSPAYAAFLTRTPHPVGADNAHGRLLRGEPVVHIADVKEDKAFAAGNSLRRSLVELGGGRTLLAVPLRKDERFFGDFVIYRREVKPFSERQIAVLRNFAAQAVIAMENARLLDELRARTGDLEESLKYQTATSDVLKVISRSTFELQPVLDTLVETAALLCQADLASINNRDDEVYRVAASFDYSPELTAYARSFPMTPGRETVTGRAALERQVVHVADLAADAEYAAPGWVTHGKVRTALGVPLLREGEPIGVIFLARRRVEPFTERQIELVRTFADQAVIAIANTRLITETREALEQQTATSDVLRVISRSTFDLQTVLETMAEKRGQAVLGGTWARFSLRRAASAVCRRPQRFAGVSRVPRTQPHYAWSQQQCWTRCPRAAHGAQPRCSKRSAIQLRGLPRRTALSAVLAVPMLRADELFGVFIVFRHEVRPFTASQIALMETFADQAVIAIENVRLITERLAKRWSSRRRPPRSCGSSTARPASSSRCSRPCWRTGHGCAKPSSERWLFTMEIHSRTWRCTTRRPDTLRIRACRSVRMRKAVWRASPGRSRWCKSPTFEPSRPTWKEIRRLSRLPTSPARVRFSSRPCSKRRRWSASSASIANRCVLFTDRQIELVNNFARQAVIAIENTRLLKELRQRTADLGARSTSSPRPATCSRSSAARPSISRRSSRRWSRRWLASGGPSRRICSAGEMICYHLVASHGVSEEAKAYFLKHPISPDRGTVSGRVALERRAVHIADVLADPEYDLQREAIKISGARTHLGIPLLREEALLGIFVLVRHARRAIHGEGDRARHQLRRSGGDRDGECAALLDEIRAAPGRTARHLRQHGRRRRDVRRRGCGLPRGTAISSRFLDLPDELSRRAAELCRLYPLSRRARRVRLGRPRGGAEPVASQDTGRNMRFERTRPDGRVIEVRHNPVPGGGFVVIYSRHHRAQTRREPKSARRATRPRAALARAEDGAGEPDPGREDGLARPAHRRHRARDQEPAQLRQQLRRAVGRIAGRAEGGRRAGDGRARRGQARRDRRDRSRC